MNANKPALDPDVFLHAAELIDDSFRARPEYPTHEFCCTMIVHGAKGSGDHREAFVDVFLPATGICRHGPFFSFDPETGDILSYDVTQPHRVLALCLMAAMVEAGDI